jgi:hypothetical protein
MDKIQQARHDKNYVLFKSHSTIVPEWQDFLDSMNISYNHFKHEKLEDSRMASGAILILNKLDPIVFDSLEFKDSKLFSSATNTMGDLYKLMGRSFSFSKFAINFVGGEHGYYIHKDDHEVISWNCIGNVEYRIYRDIDDADIDKAESNSPYESVYLNSGDIIFLPAGLAHQVVVSEPRATLIFGYM